MGIKQLRSASVDVTEQGAFSRSVPTTSYPQYSRTMSACALTPHAPGHVSGQSTCDSGIGSEATGSSERLARGASKTSLQSDVDPLDTVIPPLYATYAHCHERLFSDVPRKRTHRTGRTGPTQGLYTYPPPDPALSSMPNIPILYNFLWRLLAISSVYQKSYGIFLFGLVSLLKAHPSKLMAAFR